MKKKPKPKTFVHLKKYIYINDKYYCIAQPYTEINSPLLLLQIFYILKTQKRIKNVTLLLGTSEYTVARARPLDLNNKLFIA